MKDENLLQSDIDPSYPLIWAWLESEEETFVCSEWFRFESCKAGKKCKLSHPINTVSHLLFERKEETSNKERSCNEPVPLRSVDNHPFYYHTQISEDVFHTKRMQFY